MLYRRPRIPMIVLFITAVSVSAANAASRWSEDETPARGLQPAGSVVRDRLPRDVGVSLTATPDAVAPLQPGKALIADRSTTEAIAALTLRKANSAQDEIDKPALVAAAYEDPELAASPSEVAASGLCCNLSPGDCVRVVGTTLTGVVVCCDFNDPTYPILASWNGVTDQGGCEQCQFCDKGNCCTPTPGSYSWAACYQIEKTGPDCQVQTEEVGRNPDRTSGEIIRRESEVVAELEDANLAGVATACDVNGLQADSYVDNWRRVGFCFSSFPGSVAFSRSSACGTVTTPANPSAVSGCPFWVSTKYTPCETEGATVTITANPTTANMANQTKTVCLDPRYDIRSGEADERCVATVNAATGDPAEAYVEVSVIPISAGLVDPSSGLSVWDPFYQKYIFCSTYTAGAYAGRVRVKFLVPNGPGTSDDSWVILSYDQTGVCIPPDCDDGNGCTTDACVGGQCSHTNKPNGTSCNDGLFCTNPDACQNGTCTGPARVCPGDQCNNGVCNEITDRCDLTPKPNGTACDDGLFCNGADTCSGGSCAVHAGNPCTGQCDEENDRCTCPSGLVTFVDPWNGTVDARQPYPPSNAAQRQGIRALSVTGPTGFDNRNCWTLCETKVDGMPNSITSIVSNGDGSFNVNLARTISIGAVTMLSYTESDGTRQDGVFTSHPANINADGASSAVDILKIIDCLNDVDHALACPWGIYSCDIDQSGACGPADILRLIDLLNGADQFESWLGAALPACGACCL